MGHYLAQCLVILIVHTDFVYSKSHYVTPSPGGPCPQNSSCLTLSQFAASSSYNDTDISLLFLPGNHTLDREVLLTQLSNFSMTKYGLDNETVFVECSTYHGRFRISETTSVSLKDLHFISCGSNSVSQVKWLTITATTFQGVQEGNTVLELNEVSNASIVETCFLSNSLHYPNVNQLNSVKKILEYVYFQRSTPSGALYTAFCNVSIISGKFMHNIADIGGALVAHNSSLYLARSTHSYNTANIGGVMVTSGSTIDMDNNSFINNAAAQSGGAMVTYNDTFTIRSTTFTNNSADFKGGVMATYGDSSFDIKNSTFTNNRADRSGGVMITSGDSSFNISNSTLTNNSAEYGGVMWSSDNSSFDIRNSTFTKNSAAYGGVMRTFRGSSFNISNSMFAKNSAYRGGVMGTFGNSSFNISNSMFANNSASQDGGVMRTSRDSSFNISNSMFTKNRAYRGAIMFTDRNSSFNFSNSTLTNNSAEYGGVMWSSDNSSFNIRNSTITKNSAAYGGVMRTFGDSSFNISNSMFANNSAGQNGGVMRISSDSSFNISNSMFINNSAGLSGGVMRTSGNTSLNISNSMFINNSADRDGGVMRTSGNASFKISKSTLLNNSAFRLGGVMITFDNASFNISNSMFSNNSADRGGVMYTYGNSSFMISNSTFTNNRADGSGGVMRTSDNSSFNISKSMFTNNRADHDGVVIVCINGKFNVDSCNINLNAVTNQGKGVIFLLQCSAHITNSTFDQNIGSLYIFYSKLTFSGYLNFENFTEALRPGYVITNQEGGAITSFQSTVIFARESIVHFSNNQASQGGAILATESTITIEGEIKIGKNMATMANSSGGGISLKQSHLEIEGRCQIVNNVAVRGGGIHASSSTIAVYHPGILQVTNNSAEFGGGLYLEVNPKLYVLKNILVRSPDNEHIISCTGNRANYGGAVYVADDTNSGACSPDNECFIQALALYQERTYSRNLENILFSMNRASEQGSNLFGGLLDRCIPSPFAEVYRVTSRIHYSGITYFGNISNTELDSISSRPVRVCFCNSEHKPDCSYQPPTIRVQKGKEFNVSLVAVDQVNHTVNADISSVLSSPLGGFGEGQQTQSVGRNCTILTYNVFSPHDFETLYLYPNGPCESATFSTSHVTIQFIECTCPVGFEPLSNSQSPTRCECVCDSALSPYITVCNITTSSVLRMDTNSWITYINDTDPPKYVIYQNCPFDYCKPQIQSVIINFNIPNGADSQCAFDRTGTLCGTCKENLSLSLASSRCVPCHTHWPAVFVIILLAAAIAGILLVAALLALNMTVSVGLINGFIFYANIVSAGSAIFLPSSNQQEFNLPSLFVAWLNLDIGIDVCFIDGLDAYTKTWLKLAFPVYIISLVVLVIIFSEYSPRFAGLIGKKDPVSTLATLILLSYAKLLSVTITALSFAVLHYPDGKQETVWLPDGNVKYFQGKHIPLALTAMLIIVVGLPYTILLFLWQWIVRASKWKIFNWTTNTKLNVFIATYHVPHNSKYRYWTGLLLLVRVVLYIVASATVSANPQTIPLITNILVGGLFLFSKIFSLRVYKSTTVDVVDTVLCFNLLALSSLSQFDFKASITKQTAVAYTSTIVTFFFFIVVIFYHVFLLIKKEKPHPEDLNEYPLTPVKPAKVKVTVVTHSVIEPPKRDNQDPPPTDITYSNEQEITDYSQIVTPPYIV